MKEHPEHIKESFEKLEKVLFEVKGNPTLEKRVGILISLKHGSNFSSVAEKFGTRYDNVSRHLKRYRREGLLKFVYGRSDFSEKEGIVQESSEFLTTLIESEKDKERLMNLKMLYALKNQEETMVFDNKQLCAYAGFLDKAWDGEKANSYINYRLSVYRTKGLEAFLNIRATPFGCDIVESHEEIDEYISLLDKKKFLSPDRKKALQKKFLMLKIFKEYPGTSNKKCAEELEVSHESIRRWRVLYEEKGIEGFMAFKKHK